MRVNREEFLTQLESVMPGLSPKEIVEQSSCFVFQDNEVITYNDEIACRRATSLDITGAVAAAPLVSILQKLSADELEIEVGEGELLVSMKNRKAGIRMEKEILLPVSVVEKPNEWKPLSDEFSEAVDMVQQCAGKDESQFLATCVNIHPKWVEACDNFQLTRYKVKTGIDKSTLVRSSSIKHIVSLGMTEFSKTDAWMHFRNPSGLVLSCRLYLDEYKDISPLFDFKGTHTVLPKGLGEAMEKAEVFTSELDKDQNMVLVQMRKGKLKIKGEGKSGWYSEVKLMKYDGEDVDFNISPKLLAQITEKHNECEIADRRLKVDGGKFVYCTVLGIPGENNGKEEK